MDRRKVADDPAARLRDLRRGIVDYLVRVNPPRDPVLKKVDPRLFIENEVGCIVEAFANVLEVRRAQVPDAAVWLQTGSRS